MEHDLSFFDKTNLKWLRKNTIFLTVHGSYSYGTNIETSDIDYRGVAIAPLDYYFSFDKNFEQQIFKDPDVQIFDIRKFFNLAANCNPNVLEILFTDPSDHVIVNPIMKKLFDNREKFLTKRAKYAFFGYAKAQMHRIEGHAEKFTNPPESCPKRKDFGLPEHTLIPKEQLEAANAAIQKRLDSWNPDFSELRKDLRQEIEQKITDVLMDICGSSIYINKEDLWKEAAISENINPNIIEIIKKEREYRSKAKQWESYQTWLLERNEKRAELEKRFGYDCYSDDTEFLTDVGWKKFDEITQGDKLATVFINNKDDIVSRKHLSIEYQNYIDKFCGLYSGTMYNFFAYHLDILVTPNHRMLYKYVEKNNKKSYDWELSEAATIPNCFEFLNTVESRNTSFHPSNFNYSLDLNIRDYLKLMGWYLSDGTMSFRETGQLKAIRISQKKDGKLYDDMIKFKNDHDKCSLYIYTKKPNVFRNSEIQEALLCVCDKETIKKMYEDCGHKENKRIPRWVYGLPNVMKKLLIDEMCKGDGTIRQTSLKTTIYYTNNKNLANDVQELALMCGYETTLYGPYTYKKVIDKTIYAGIMYHVHINMNAHKTRVLCRSYNVKKIEVENKRIVCFTVPNGTLIVRRNGKVSIQGNSKHALHLVRLSRMCVEILSEGKMIVKRPDAKELIAIRNGSMTRQQLIDYADEMQKKIDELYDKSSLPETPDRVYLNNLCCEIIEEFLNVK